MLQQSFDSQFLSKEECVIIDDGCQNTARLHFSTKAEDGRMFSFQIHIIAYLSFCFLFSILNSVFYLYFYRHGVSSWYITYSNLSKYIILKYFFNFILYYVLNINQGNVPNCPENNA